MTALKVSQLPSVSVLSVNDEIILNDVDQTPVATCKATLLEVFTFAESNLTFNTAQISLVNPQAVGVTYSGVKGRPELGGPIRGRTIVSGVLPPIGTLNTQEDYNIWLVNAVVALDDEIDRIEEDGVGVVEVKAGTGLVTSPVNGIVSSGTISVGADVVLTDVKQTISSQKTFTATTTFTAGVNAQSTLTVTGDADFAGNITSAGTVDAVAFTGDGSQLSGIVAGGSVTSIVPGDGLLSGLNTGTNNDTPITTTGSISVNNTVLRTTGDQSVGGVKTFTGTPEFDNGLKTSGNITPTTTITIGNNSTQYLGDGSQLSGLPTQGVSSVTPADGIMLGATSGTPNNTAITSTGSISVDNTVVRTNASGTQELTGALTVDGNIKSENGIFIGDGSGLSNISAVAGPFVFAGNVDAVNGSPPTDPVPADAFIYFNTVAGVVNNNWPGIEGDNIGVDQMVVYSGQLSGWALGSAVDRGTFVAVDGGTMTGSLIIEQNLSVTGNASITGAVTAAGGVTSDLTGDVTGDVTGNVTGNLTGNATSATNATNATNANNVNLALATGSDDFYLPLSPSTTGAQALKTDGQLLFNAETDTFGAQNIACMTLGSSTTIEAIGNITTTTGAFVGPLTGNADTATTAGSATTATTASQSDKVKVALNTSDAAFAVPFVTTVGEYEDVLKNTNLTFNPNSDTLTVLNVSSTSVTTTSATVNGPLDTDTITNSGDLSTKNLTVNNGTLTSTDNILTNLTTSGDVSMVDADITGTLTVDTVDVTTGSITTLTSESITVTGSVEVQGSNANGDPYTFIGDGSGLTNLQISGAEGGTVTSIQVGTGLTTPEGTPNPITGAGTITIDSTVITTNGGQAINGQLDVETLDVTTGDENTDSITAPGIIRGGYFVGDGSGLSGIAGSGGTVTSITGATNGGITTSPVEGITITGTLSLDSTVVRTTGLQEIGGNKNFTAKGDFQAGLDITGNVGGLDAIYYGDGTNLSGVTNNPGTVTSISAGAGLATSVTDGDPITSSGSLSVDDTVVRTTGNQSIGGTKTFTASNTFDLDTTFSQNVGVTGTVTAEFFEGDGSKLKGIKAGMFAFKGDTSVLGDPPAAESGDVFQNTTAGDATDEWVGIAGLPVAQNQLLIYGLGGAGVNIWFRGSIADTGQFLSTSGGTVDGNVSIDGTLGVSGIITGTLTGTATTATKVTKDVTAGDGLQGGGELTADVTLSVKTNGDTIISSADGIRVDGTKIDAATAGSAGTADTASKVQVTQIDSDGTYYLTGAQGNGGQGLQSSTSIYLNPSEGAIYATTFEGSGADLTGLVYDTTNQDVAGVKNFTSFPTVPFGDGVNPSQKNEVASKQYVDDLIIASGSGTVVSVGAISDGGLITSLPGNAAITTSGNLGIDTDKVVMVDGTQSITGTKTFTVDTNFSNDIDVTGIVKAASYEGDGSSLTGVSNNQGTVTSITAGTGISVGGNDITVSGSIAVDGTVLRNSGAQSIDAGGSLTVGGNIKVTDGGKFEGDGSLLTNLPIALGPFNFKGETDVTTDDLPDPVGNGDIYINTVAGIADDAWTGIAGQTVAQDQIVVYQNTSGTPGWLLGSALDRGQFVPTSGGTFTGGVSVSGTFNATQAVSLSSTLAVTGTSTLTGLVSSSGGFKTTGSGVFTGDLVGNASTATSATSADNATNATTATTATTAAVADAVTVEVASDDVDYFLVFAQTGDKPLKANSQLSFNPTDQILELTAALTSTKNITTTGDVSASNLAGAGASVTDVDALTCQKQVIAGTGLTGGGILSADVTVNVGAGLGIVANADDITVKVKTGGGLTLNADGLAVDFSAAPPAASISTTPPTSAVAGDLWWDSDSGEMYIYYQDSDSAQWVSVTPLVATQAAAITALQGQVNTLLARVTALESA